MANGNMIPGKTKLHTLIVVLILMQTAAPALACPVCFSANKKSRSAFIFTTGLLSAMPWVAIGSGVLWYKRRLRRLDEMETEEEKSDSDQDIPPRQE